MNSKVPAPPLACRAALGASGRGGAGGGEGPKQREQPSPAFPLWRVCGVVALLGVVVLLVWFWGRGETPAGSPEQTPFVPQTEKSDPLPAQSPIPSRRGTSSTTRPDKRPAASRKAVSRVVSAGGEVLFRLSWGRGRGQVGLWRRPEAQAVGPAALAWSRDGSFWIVDTVRRSLLHLSAQGKVLSRQPLQRAVYDLLRGPKGRFWFMDLQRRQVGVLGEGQPSPWPAASMVGTIIPDGLHREGAKVWLRTVEQRLVAPDGSTQRPSPVQTRKVGAHKGLIRLAATGHNPTKAPSPAVTIPVVTRRELASVVYLGADEAGDVYVRIDTFPAGKIPGTGSVHRYSRQGRPRGSVQLRGISYTPIQRSLVLGPPGWIYQLYTTRQGVEVIAWQLQDGVEFSP